MGDNGKLYIDEAVVPAYRLLLHNVDLILPNQFELELVSLPLAIIPCLVITNSTLRILTAEL